MKKLFVWGTVIVTLSLLIYYFYPEPALSKDARIDRLLVFKEQRIMKAYQGNTLLKVYHVSLGKHAKGHKQEEGDYRTPEGQYIINDRNPNSQYYKNLGISYPNKDDIDNANRRNANPGGQIKIHGLHHNLGFIGKFHRVLNWTAGCIAVTNTEMEELYQATKKGAIIEINP